MRAQMPRVEKQMEEKNKWIWMIQAELEKKNWNEKPVAFHRHQLIEFALFIHHRHILYKLSKSIG